MGKVVPFVRQEQKQTQTKGETRPSGSALRKAITDHNQTREVRAEELIVEAAKILEDDKSASRIPWLLEDCIDLLKTEKSTAGTGSTALDSICSGKENGQSRGGQKDPRHMLNRNSDLSSMVRLKD